MIQSDKEITENKAIASLFAPFNIALLAKNNGFIDSCLGYFFIKKTYSDAELRFGYRKYMGDFNSFSYTISAPLYQQIVDWFRNKHKIDIWVERIASTEDCLPERWFFQCPQADDKNLNLNHWADTYQEALDKAIEEAFKLIQSQHE